MCTGELPEPEKREEQARLVTNKKFGELILWCIEDDPDMRPSMEEIIEKLEQLINGDCMLTIVMEERHSSWNFQGRELGTR